MRCVTELFKVTFVPVGVTFINGASILLAAFLSEATTINLAPLLTPEKETEAVAELFLVIFRLVRVVLLA